MKNGKNIPIIFLSLFITILGKAQVFTNYTTTDGLLSNEVNCLAVGNGNEIWLGTQAGISKYDGTNWTGYTTTDGLVDNIVLAIFQGSAGDLWAGTDFGLSRFDGVNWTTFTTTDGLGNNRIKCVAEAPNGDIWVGTNNGASAYSGGSWTSWGTTDGLPFGGVTAIAFDNSGKPWLGLGLSGVAVYDGNSFSIFDEVDGLLDNRVRAIAFDTLDQAWIATAGGVSVFNNSQQLQANHTRMYILPPPDTLNPTVDVAIDSEGKVWTGIYVDYLVNVGGIAAYGGAQWTDYDQSNGLIGPVIRALAVDQDDHIWVATSTGVSELDKATIGIEKPTAQNQFEVYPNPSTDRFSIQLNTAPIQSGEKLEIFDLNMKLVASISLIPGQNQYQISLGDQQSGIYFARRGNGWKKIILE